MATSRSFGTLFCLCMSLLILSAEALPLFPKPSRSVGEMVAASILGAIMGGVTHRVKLQKMRQEEDIQASAQHQQPVFAPWQAPLPPLHPHLMPQIPLQHNMMPLMHPQPTFHHPLLAPMPLMPLPDAWLHQQLNQMQHLQNPGVPRFDQMEQMSSMHWNPTSQSQSLMDIADQILRSGMPRGKCNMH